MEGTHMGVDEHLEEARRRIIWVLFTFIIFLCIGFIFVEDLYQWIVQAADQDLAILGPADILWIYFVLSGSASLIATMPVALLHIWWFIKPAITKAEQRIVLLFIPALFSAFIIGISFGYFIVFPSVLGFLKTLSADQVITMYTAEKYFGFLMHLTLPLGFLFEMPLLIMLLTQLGFINPIQLAKARKMAYLILTIISTLVTPPDFISALIVAAPLILLYELSITISKYVYRKRLALQQ